MDDQFGLQKRILLFDSPTRTEASLAIPLENAPLLFDFNRLDMFLYNAFGSVSVDFIR